MLITLKFSRNILIKQLTKLSLATKSLKNAPRLNGLKSAPDSSAMCANGSSPPPEHIATPLFPSFPLAGAPPLPPPSHHSRPPLRRLRLSPPPFLFLSTPPPPSASMRRGRRRPLRRQMGPSQPAAPLRWFLPLPPQRLELPPQRTRGHGFHQLLGLAPRPLRWAADPTDRPSGVPRLDERAKDRVRWRFAERELLGCVIVHADVGGWWGEEVEAERGVAGWLLPQV